MSKHENTRQSALRELLNEPGIAKTRPIHQPANGALLTLEITQVLPYDRNPRLWAQNSVGFCNLRIFYNIFLNA